MQLWEYGTMLFRKIMKSLGSEKPFLVVWKIFLSKMFAKSIIVIFNVHPGGGGGFSREFWIGVCREGSWTLTLFKD